MCHIAYVLPGNVLLAESLEDRGRTSRTGVVGIPAGRLVGVVNETAGRSRSSELAVGVGRARVFRELSGQRALITNTIRDSHSCPRRQSSLQPQLELPSSSHRRP